MNDMKSLPFRILLLASMTFITSAIIVRLVWEFDDPITVGSMVVVILLMFAVLGTCALAFYLTIKPSLKKLKSLPVAISGGVIATSALIDVIIHFIRFIPSPEAASTISVVIASLLLAAVISAYILVLWLLWSIRKTGRG